jgi:hypothetical protein
MSSTNEMPLLWWLLLAWFLPSAVILFCVSFSYVGARKIYRDRVSKAWPTAEGTILESSLESASYRRPNLTHRAKVLYSFVVDGNTYSGDTLDFTDFDRESEDARSVLNRYPKNKVVSVHYLPSDPSVSVLEPGRGHQRDTWVSSVVCLVFFCLAVAEAIGIRILLRSKTEAI